MPIIMGDITGVETWEEKIPKSVNHIVHMAGSVKFGEIARQEVEKINL